MQVKVLKNLLHNGVTHTPGSIIELGDIDISHLVASGIVTEDVTQNPAKLDDKVEAPREPELPAEPGVEEDKKSAKLPDVEEGGSEDADVKKKSQEEIEEGGSED